MHLFLVKAFVLFLVILSNEARALECPTDFKRPSYQTRSFYCDAGSYVADYYNFDSQILCEEMEVDHLIPLKIAHCQGLQGERLKAFANDPRNLKFTYWLTNRQKAAKGLLEFSNTLPEEMRDRVLIDGIEVMQDYDLPIDKQLYTALLKVAKSQQKTLGASSKARRIFYKGELVTPKRAIKKASDLVSQRTAAFAGREVAILPLEHIPLLGTGLALGFIAWDLSDSCATLNDLNELQRALYPNDVSNIQSETVCGIKPPTLGDLKDTISDTEQIKHLYETVKVQAAQANFDLQLPQIVSWPELKLPEVPEFWNNNVRSGFLENIWGD